MTVDACRACNQRSALPKAVAGTQVAATSQGSLRDHPSHLSGIQANPETFNLELYLKHMVFASQVGPFCWASRPLRPVLCWRAQSQADPSAPQLQGQKLLSDSAAFTKLFFCRMWFPFN